MTCASDTSSSLLLHQDRSRWIVGLIARLDRGFDVTTYRTVDVDGIDVFYREAGPADAPALLLLHGFPSSSRMWQPLMDRLADRFRLIAPDYPGFGHSSWPTDFGYTF